MVVGMRQLFCYRTQWECAGHDGNERFARGEGRCKETNEAGEGSEKTCKEKKRSREAENEKRAECCAVAVAG